MREVVKEFHDYDHHFRIEKDPVDGHFYGLCDGVLAVSAASIGGVAHGLLNKYVLATPPAQVIDLDAERRKRRG